MKSPLRKGASPQGQGDLCPCEERSARNLLEKYFSGLSLALLLLCVKRISQKIAASVKLCRYFATCFYRKLLELRTHVIDSLRI